MAKRSLNGRDDVGGGKPVANVVFSEDLHGLQAYQDGETGRITGLSNETRLSFGTPCTSGTLAHIVFDPCKILGASSPLRRNHHEPRILQGLQLGTSSRHGNPDFRARGHAPARLPNLHG